MKEDEKQLQQFLAGHKKEITDNGFSDKVMRRLPEKQRTPGLVWIFAVISTLIVIFTGNYTRIYYITMAIFDQTYWWLLPVLSCALAAAIIAAVTLHERKEAIFR